MEELYIYIYIPFQILLKSYKLTEWSFKNSHISTLTPSCSTMDRPSRSSKSSRPVQCGFGQWLSVVSQEKKGLVTLKQQTSKFSGSNYFTLQVDSLKVDILDPDLQHCFSKPLTIQNIQNKHCHVISFHLISHVLVDILGIMGEINLLHSYNKPWTQTLCLACASSQCSSMYFATLQ